MRDGIFGAGDFGEVGGRLRMFSEDEIGFGFLFFESGFGGHGVFFLVEGFGEFLKGGGLLESEGIGLHVGWEGDNQRFKKRN